jgi:quinol monooxygenase YgiN
METLGILARIEAKPGKEQEVLEFLKSALPLAEGESQTVKWYALQIGPSTFGIFDTFDTNDGRQQHLNGRIAASLLNDARHLLAEDPVIEMVDVLAAK